MGKVEKIIFNYYQISSKIKRSHAIAISNSETKLSYDPAIEVVQQGHIFFDFVLKKYTPVTKTQGEYSDDLSDLDTLWLDYLPNNLMFPLMSERMKEIINSCLKGNEGITWLPVMVKSDFEQKLYFVPKFERKLNVLNSQKTKYVKNTDLIIMPVFSFLEIAKYALFSNSGDDFNIPRIIYTNGAVKRKIIKEKLIGVYFEKIYNIWY